MMSTTDAVNTVRATPKTERTAKVNEFLAGNSTDAMTLQWRALLVTELREAEVWPQGCGKN